MTQSSEALLVALMGRVDALAIEVAETRHEIRAHDERMISRGDQFGEMLRAVNEIAHRPTPLAPISPVWNAQNVKLALLAVLVLAAGNLGADGLRELITLVSRATGLVK